jgi:asparagine synthase (glutamine-hydrolysing)
MCGIVATINTHHTVDNIESALQTLAHRGQDDRHVWTGEGLHIGHNRLAITGKTGTQPMVSRDERLVSCVNGEFYDHQTIAKHYPQYSFMSQCDSEILLPLYQQHGCSNALFDQLNGEYAGLLYDRQSNKVFAFRDPMGVKPLYYYQKNNTWIFASEIKAIRALTSLSWDMNSLSSVLLTQYHSHHDTLCEDVHQVPAGTCLCIDLHTNEITTLPFFQWRESPIDLPFDEAKAQLQTHMNNAVNRRLDTNKKVGVALSGGIDSAYIYGIAKEHNTPVNPYTISFKGDHRYNEIDDVKKITQRFGEQTNAIIVDEHDMINALSQSVYHGEQVAINAHLPAKYLLFQAMKKDGIQISLSGEGADELFWGYPHLRLDQNASDTIAKNNAYLAGVQVSDGQQLDTQHIQKQLGFVPEFLKAKYSIGYKMAEHALNTQNLRDFHQPAAKLLRDCGKISGQSKAFVSAYLWSKVCLGNYILTTLGDKMEMAATIEGRVPFLDKHVIEFSRRLPAHYKINTEGVEKFLLKESAKSQVPAHIYQKQKHPFVSPPLLSWGNKQDSVNAHLRDTLHSDFITQSPLFDQHKLQQWHKQLQQMDSASQARYDPMVFLLLTLRHFHEHFIA